MGRFLTWVNLGGDSVDGASSSGKDSALDESWGYEWEIFYIYTNKDKKSLTLAQWIID